MVGQVQGSGVDWGNAGFDVKETDKGGLKARITDLFQGRIRIKVEQDGEKKYLVLTPKSELGTELLKIYRNGGKTALNNAVGLLDPNTALTDSKLALKIIRSNKGTRNSTLGRAAAEKLYVAQQGEIGHEWKKGVEGVMIAKNETGMLVVHYYNNNKKIRDRMITDIFKPKTKT